MKVQVVEKTDEDNDFRSSIIIFIDGEKVFSVRDDEPEDSSLSRSFSDCYNVASLLKQAYDAGKNGEPFELVE